ncbi:MAG: hypothetical protein J07HB67_01818 [halophilic archaeon J07HB67]|jgi:hypothetical protein|nr:MAG: hypothetical protein J07HB67_01818 [halophilic archaeon J07HB67]
MIKLDDHDDVDLQELLSQYRAMKDRIQTTHVRKSEREALKRFAERLRKSLGVTGTVGRATVPLELYTCTLAAIITNIGDV